MADVFCKERKSFASNFVGYGSSCEITACYWIRTLSRTNSSFGVNSPPSLDRILLLLRTFWGCRRYHRQLHQCESFYQIIDTIRVVFIRAYTNKYLEMWSLSTNFRDRSWSKSAPKQVQDIRFQQCSQNSAKCRSSTTSATCWGVALTGRYSTHHQCTLRWNRSLVKKSFLAAFR